MSVTASANNSSRCRYYFCYFLFIFRAAVLELLHFIYDYAVYLTENEYTTILELSFSRVGLFTITPYSPGSLTVNSII